MLITVDTLRSDHLPIYGYDRLETPVLQAFADAAITFDKAYAQAPLTLPSHASLFTGLLPTEHGVRENAGYRLAEDWETLAERFRAAGYRTGGFVSSMVLRRATGIAQGFDHYDDHLNQADRPRAGSYAERPGTMTIAAAAKWLEAQPDGRFFLWLHLYEPHRPYQPPPPHDRHAHPYDGEIAYTDTLLKTFFEALEAHDFYQTAVVVVTSDHGEGLGDHGEDEHGLFVYREAIQVPLLIRLPHGLQGGTRNPVPVALIDLFPTVLGLAGLNAEPRDGRNLFDPRNRSRPRAIYSEAMTPALMYGWHAHRSAIHADLHYLEGYEPELFDLAADPRETNNLYGTRPVPEAAKTLLEQAPPGKNELAAISAEDRAMLESLGYLGSFEMGQTTRDLRPDQFLEIYRTVARCRDLFNQQRYAAAEQLLAEGLTRYPDMLEYRVMLGHALNFQGRHEQARHVLGEGLAGAPNHHSILAGLVAAELGVGNRERALVLADKCMATSPALQGRTIIQLMLGAGLLEPARRYARQLMAFNPNEPLARLILAKEAHEQRRYREAVTHLEHALPLLDPEKDFQNMRFCLLYLGDSLALMGDTDRAVTVFRQGLRHDPNHGEIRTSLCRLHAARGERKQAVATLTEWLKAFPTRENYRKAAETMAELGNHEAAQYFREQAAKL